MKSKITIVGLALLSILSCKILKPSADKFITYKHQSRQMNVLIHRVDKASWKIGYRYGSECKSEDRQNDKALQEEITTILRTWLKPLRDMKPAALSSMFSTSNCKKISKVMNLRILQENWP